VPTSYRGAARAVENLRDRLGDDIEDEVDGATEGIGADLRRRLSLEGSVATRTLRRSLYPEPSDEVTVSPLVVSRQISAPDYWKYVEYGTGTKGEGLYDSPSGSDSNSNADSRTLYDAILAWIIAKNIQPRSDDIGGQYELAEVISRQIVNSGTESHPFVRPTLRGDNGRDRVERAIKRAMRRAKRRSV